MELRREMNMAIHEAKFSFTRLKIIVWGQARSKTGKRKEEREGEKVRVRKRRRKEFSLYVIENALACYSSPIQISPSSSRIIP